MNETLRQLRLSLGWAESDMAAALGLSIPKYMGIESKNEPIPLNYLMKIANTSGKTIDELVNFKKETVKFSIKDEWKTVSKFKEEFKHFFDSEFAKISTRVDDEFKDEVSFLNKCVTEKLRKPRVALVGRSDVGKSSLINSLLGSKKLPEEWTPTTSIVICVKHINDKPAYVKDNVLIFKSEQSADLWDDTRLFDEEYTKSLCIASGDYSLLKDFGSRQGSRYKDTEASSAVVFVESDILANCDFLDLPGYGTKDRTEDDSLLQKVKNVDILVYLSLANGFMRGDDIQWLQGELPNLSPISLNNKKLKPLENLFIVASQAHTVSNGSLSALDTILKEGAKRFDTTLSDSYWSNLGQDVDCKAFSNRFYTFSKDQEVLRRKFCDDFRSLLERMPKIIVDTFIDFLKDNISSSLSRIDKSICSFREIISKRQEKKKEYRELEGKRAQTTSERENQKTQIRSLIETSKKEAIDDFVKEYNSVINVDNIVRIIIKNNWSKKDEDMKLLSSKLSNLLNDALGKITKHYSEKLKDAIDKFLDKFEKSITISFSDNKIDSRIGFDTKAAFAGGLAGVASFGALALWASSLGNLGAYILVAKGVSILASIGISVGGTAAATGAIAAIGGPIVLGIGIAVLIGLLFSWLFGDWKKKVAKKIVSQYDEKNVLRTYKNNIVSFWDNTLNAFNKAVDALEKAYDEYMENLRKDIESTSDDEILNKISVEELKKAFFNGLIANL